MAFEYLADIPGEVAKNIEAGERTQAQYQANQASARELWKAKKLASIMSTYRKPNGDLDEVAAADAAVKSDLVPEFRSAVLGAEQGEMAKRADIAQNRFLLEQMGAPSQVGVYIPPRGGQIPAKPSQETDATGFITSDMEQPAQVAPKVGPNGLASEEVNVTASLPAMPDPEMMTQLPERRGNMAEALDYKPKSVSEMMGSVTGGQIFGDSGEGDAELEWTPEDDATAFRQYGKSLASEAKATGIEPKEMLRKIRDDAAAKVLKPLPNLLLATQGGKEGLVKYTQQVAERALSEQQARAAGSKAVADYRAGLVGKAKEFGAVTHEEEKFGADMGGRRAGLAQPGVERFRAVSQPEKERGERLAEVYQDLEAGFKRGTFEGDYGAAIAKAKQDGSVNSDAVVSNLVAMGAWPSTRAVALKNILSDTPGSITGDGYKLIKQKVGNIDGADQKARASWYKDAIENINNALYGVGLRVKEGTKKDPTPAEIGKMKPAEARAYMAKKHADNKAKKAAPQPAPAAKPQAKGAPMATSLDEF